MNKVLVTEQHLIDIADAVRKKLNSDEKMLLSDVAAKILNIPAEAPAGGGNATMFKVNVSDPGEGQEIVVTCDGEKKTTSFSAEKGSVITANLNGLDGYIAGNLSIEGGKMFPDMSYSLIEDMLVSATPAVKPQEGRVFIASETVNATSDGSLKGYTLARLNKCIPNHQGVHFEVKIFCPTGVTLSAGEGIAVGDFKTGRAWGNKNAFVSAHDYETKAISGGTEYILGWDEKIDEDSSAFIWDDDKANGLLTYYLCSETSVTGSGDLTKATLTFSAYKI